MRVFVTGASGFVGGHFVETASKAHEVSALARSEKSAAQVQKFGARPVRGELGSVRVEDLAGVDVVVHAAAFVEEWGTREQFWSANVEGTTQLLEAAKKAGVRRFIHVGTEAALFDGRDLVNVDEAHPYPARQKYLYSETKAEAERRVLAASDKAMTAMSIRPRFVWGPRDTSVLPTVLRMARDGSFAWIDGGKHPTSTTHVANLVHALMLALEKGEGGHAYFVADDGERTVRAFLTALAATQGADLGKRSIPGPIARSAARVVEGAWRLFGVKKAPPMTRFAVDMMSRSVTVNTLKARRALGYRPVISVDEGMSTLRAPT
ncbi:MAG: NAD-dependent epimerase/dehydratase family protein [Polyangiaceae bacterium]|nr:NAD-dependent epimerase/dehydratase family protein [Polyangiaceae bacterium]